MKRRPSPQEWADEFKSFATSSEATPPQHLSEQILAKVHADLDPAVWLVAGKLSLIHLLVGTLTLLFCPQFGIHFADGLGLMSVLMQYGDSVCMLGCGAVFMMGSAWVASLALSREEVQKIRKTECLLFPALTLFSLGAFVCANGTIALGLALFWFIGSTLGGWVTLEVGWRIRSSRTQRLPI